jgi:hypothetical protein
VGRSRQPSASDHVSALRRGSADPPSSLTTPGPQRLPAITWIGFGLFPFRSPLLREYFLFLEVLRCFSSLGALHASYVFRCGSPGLVLVGFPHSEMSGSPFATNSPDLIAGNRVLHRPQAPRHSPCALCSLTYFFSIQPGPRTGRTDACGSPIHTIGTISLLAKLAICLPLHLLRCTTRSFELAHGQYVHVRGLEQTCGSGL